MRTWFAWVAVSLAAGLACQAASTAKPKPDTERYEKVLREATSVSTKVSLEEILEALKAMVKKDAFLSEAFPAFLVACDRVDERRLPELVEIFRRIPADEFRKPEYFVPLGQAWLRLKVPAELEKRPKFPEVAVKTKMPKALPEAEKAAVRRYRAVMDPFRQSMDQPVTAEGRNFQGHEAEYWQLVESLLDSGKGPFSEQLKGFGWGGGCGTGSEIFVIPQSTALAIALAVEGKWKEAAGAALSVRGVDVSGSLHLLSACVADPQEAVLGGLACFEIDSNSYFFGQASLLAMAMDLPGNSRARGLMTLAARASGYDQAGYFRALAILAREGPGDVYVPMGIFSGEDLGGAKMEPLDKETRAKVRAFLCSQDVSQLSIAGADELVRILADSEWPEAVPALRGLLDHPSAKIAESAAQRLKAAGITVQVPPKLGPVRCRLMVDGKPYAGKRVQWYISWDEMGMGDEVTSDAEGIVDVPRDHFIDKKSSSIRAFGLHSMDLKEVSDPWFGVKLAMPKANDEVIPVEIKTSPVRIRLPQVRPDAELEGKFIKVKASSRTWPEPLSLGFYCIGWVGVPVARDFALNVAPGEYGVEVRVPGATVWGGKVEGGKEKDITLPVVRASAVRYACKLPEGWPEHVVWPEFLQDGKRVTADEDTDRRVIRGVREGKYVLRFPSSAELRKKYEFWKMIKAADFEGVDVPVEVKADSPVEIDLGEIVLK